MEYRGKMQPIKQCEHHRALQRARNKSPAGKASHTRALKSPAGIAGNLKRYASTKYKDARRARKKTEAGRERARHNNKTPAGRARVKRNQTKQYAKLKADPTKKLKHYISCRVREIVRTKGSSVTISTKTSLPDSDSIRQHLESTWPADGSMSWANHGHRGPDKWNIGHRIAVAMFDFSVAEDVCKCWSLDNIFAQWSVENQMLGVKLPCDDELLRLKHCWPASWNSTLPSAAARQAMEQRVRNVFGNHS
tara:strand:- start:2596 stop:3345 length:750 start_codon:yes stop_codon:yes gene_type:complete